MSVPNAVWCADFKDQFKTRDGLYCYPLTVTDDYSKRPSPMADPTSRWQRLAYPHHRS
jgi:hypothetical protein